MAAPHPSAVDGHRRGVLAPGVSLPEPRGVPGVARAFGCEITRPITPLELVNRIAGRPLAVRNAFFRGPDGEEIELIEDETGQT